MGNGNTSYGGFWKRLLALIIDSLIVTTPFMVVSIIRGSILDFWGWMQPFYVIADIIYYVYFEGILGATLGKRAVGLALVAADGRYPVGWGTALLRYFARSVSLLILGIGMLMIPFSERKQGLHDRIANTYVVGALTARQGGPIAPYGPNQGVISRGISKQKRGIKRNG